MATEKSKTVVNDIDQMLDIVEQAVARANAVYRLAEDVIESKIHQSEAPQLVYVNDDALNRLADAIGYKKSTGGAG